MTRPQPQATAFVAALKAAAACAISPVYSPLLKIVPLHPTVAIRSYQGVVFTSATAIDHAGRLNVQPSLPAYCVGPATTQSAIAAGWSAIQCGVDANGLIEHLIAHKPAAPILHLRGQHTRGQVAERLTASELHCDSVALYDQQLCGLTIDAQALLASGQPVIAPIFSPRTARHFADQAKINSDLHLIALSDAVAEPLMSLQHKALVVSDSPDAVGMIRAIVNVYKNVQRVEGNGSPL
ncbi:MAG: uroporphyrinogen-III synthase [Paracoccaceae bacterium]